jgi:hypothetical protein
MLEANSMIQLGQNKIIHNNKRTARVHTERLIEVINTTRTEFTIFTSELKAANRLCDGNIELTDPSAVSALREYAIEISTALAWAGMAQNSPDMKITVHVADKKEGAVI